LADISIVTGMAGKATYRKEKKNSLRKQWEKKTATKAI